MNNTIQNIDITIKEVNSHIWQPTPLIRWKKVEIDKLHYDKILQQLWKNMNGEQEWRNVPEEYE